MKTGSVNTVMIRKLQKADINKVADIWLNTNIKAHSFIPAKYWKDNFELVKELLLQAEVYIYEKNLEIQGFIGLNGEYIEQIKCLKESLILQYKPELLGEMKDIPVPDFSNEASVKEYFGKIKTRSEMIAEMPDSIIPMDFHLYKIRIDDDFLEMEIDYTWNIFGTSYSGNKAVMKRFKRIARDLYSYYGVTEEDIRNKTKRYSSLVTNLSS